MPFNNNYQIGIVNNPLTRNPYNEDWKEGVIAPGNPRFLITEDGKYIITEDGRFIVTES